MSNKLKKFFQGSCFLILMIIIAFPAVAADDEGLMNRLFAPGPLAKGHADLEGKQCLKCHEGGKGVPDSKCLSCHDQIATFVQTKLGYHGHMTQSCITCHSDHKGREYDSTSFDFKAFDHKTTGYPLIGKHAELKCVDCHKRERGLKRVRPHDPIFLGGNATSCRGCHAKDDVHFFKGIWQQKDCNACHSLEKWTTGINFDHKRDTKYPLVGSHAQLTCKECHTPKSMRKGTSIYKWPKLKSQQCLACHENFHKNTLSSRFQNGECTTCHNQTKWALTSFDHSVTQYSLRGAHAKAACTDCHKDSLFSSIKPKALTELSKVKWTGLKTACLSCHEDFHRFGKYISPAGLKTNNCTSCHSEDSWKSIHDFEHNASTRYKIDGEHKKLKCAECHLAKNKIPFPVTRAGIYLWPHLMDKTCENCHKSPHIGKFSPALAKKRCTECHVTEGWKVVRTDKGFDHSKTRFALTGKHREATCTQCHVKNKQQVFRWNSTDKGFCVECHENVHKNQFDPQLSAKSCSECHSSDNFTKRLPFNHGTTRYPLKGSHVDVKCEGCHIKTDQLFPVKPPKYMRQFVFPQLEASQCLSCHKDVHQGQLGSTCTKCHTESKWSAVQFDHQKQSKFPLMGKHQELKCQECHKPDAIKKVSEFNRMVAVVKYKPIVTNCVSCHKDVHKGHFGNACISCHSEKSWKVTKDFHKNFSLSGVHFALQCNECHGKEIKLGGLSQECIFCHKKDDIHSGTLPECGSCHLQTLWEYSKFRHSMTTFPLKGAHRVLQCQECHQRGVYQGLSPDCFSCHQKDMLQAQSPVHSPAANFINCIECHHGNQFAW